MTLEDKSSAKRRSSSFTTSSSPWSRRNSFLSPTMIHDEQSSFYEASSFFSGSSKHSIISLRESQGFIFNQDLFASPYQQLQSLAREKRYRSLSMSQHRSKKGIRTMSDSFMDNTRFRRQVNGRHDNAIEDDEYMEDCERDASPMYEDEEVGDNETDQYTVSVTDIVVENDNSIYPTL